MDTFLAFLSKLGFVTHTWVFPTLSGLVLAAIISACCSFFIDPPKSNKSGYENLHNNEEGKPIVDEIIRPGVITLSSVLDLVINDKLAALDLIMMSDISSVRTIMWSDFHGKKFKMRVLFVCLAILIHIFPIIFATLIPSNIGYTYIRSSDRMITQKFITKYFCQESNNIPYALSYTGYTGELLIYNTDLNITAACKNIGVTDKGDLFAICTAIYNMEGTLYSGKVPSILIATQNTITCIGDAVEEYNTTGIVSNSLITNCMIEAEELSSNNSNYLSVMQHLRAVPQIAYNSGQETYAVALGMISGLVMICMLMILIVTLLFGIKQAWLASKKGLNLVKRNHYFFTFKHTFFSNSTRMLTMLMQTRDKYCYQDIMDLEKIESIRTEDETSVHYSVGVSTQVDAEPSKKYKVVSDNYDYRVNYLGILKLDEYTDQLDWQGNPKWVLKDVGILNNKDYLSEQS
jgi:hypothetical protein